MQGTRVTALGAYVDATDAWDDSLTWSAGGLVSTAHDELAWFAALFDGRVTSAPTLATMKTPVALPDGSTSPFAYDLEVTPSRAGTYFGHDGGGSGADLLAMTAFGFHAHLGAFPDRGIVVVVLANTGTSDVHGARDAALRILAL